ncbi:2S sulfur-rich seed storage protein large chain 2 like [Actinidia chinensis var. chinensis]|uniref:2S sulfur-rich seed storage protein large chain 2 like n=1 Tax=Actinidia chinensis var. chinensis TaxID=1590841 RepID=A0A2R6QWY9_ACTCC|nr:2S sulfur-rich seed storage protein large chain 2 like [Actinidia chinensis var. chinensis]
MAKLTFLATALVALLAIGSVSAHQTTITTTMVEEENPGQQKCREQIQRQQNLRHCQMYLAQGRDQYEVAMVTDRNPQQQQHLRECCQQLRSIDEECRCEGVRMAVRQQQGQREREEIRQVMQKAQDLPSRCNLSPHRCEIQAGWV